MNPDTFRVDEQRLWAGFFEWVKGGSRTQYLVLPPARTNLGVPSDVAGSGATLFMKRAITRPGHRAKWAWINSANDFAHAQRLAKDWAPYQTTPDWVFRPAIVIPLDADDYVTAWRGKTPYKALRHVEAVAKKRGYRLIDE